MSDRYDEFDRIMRFTEMQKDQQAFAARSGGSLSGELLWAIFKTIGGSIRNIGWLLKIIAWPLKLVWRMFIRR